MDVMDIYMDNHVILNLGSLSLEQGTWALEPVAEDLRDLGRLSRGIVSLGSGLTLVFV